jgi:hypothetical protein
MSLTFATGGGITLRNWGGGTLVLVLLLLSKAVDAACKLDNSIATVPCMPWNGTGTSSNPLFSDCRSYAESIRTGIEYGSGFESALLARLETKLSRTKKKHFNFSDSTGTELLVHATKDKIKIS